MCVRVALAVLIAGIPGTSRLKLSRMSRTTDGSAPSLMVTPAVVCGRDAHQPSSFDVGLGHDASHLLCDVHKGFAFRSADGYLEERHSSVPSAALEGGPQTGRTRRLPGEWR
jgi:hypothetical protein